MRNIELIEKYFNGLSNIQVEQFGRLKGLYEEWNAQINVISRKDIEQLYERHVLHSLAIAKVIQFKKNTSILDIGTGGGFPGVPLAIMFPESNFTLIDSIAKKIKVVNAIAQEIGLNNCNAYQARAEKVKDKFDFIVSRAVKPLPTIYQWVHQKVKEESLNDLPNGILYLKGGNFTDELVQLRTRYTIYDIPKYFEEEFFETKKVAHIYK